jgi:hypothetical protein
MTLRDPARNIVVFFAGMMATVIIGHTTFEMSYHVVAYNPPLGLLCVFLCCVTFLWIGYFATRFPVLQSAFVVLLGSLIVTVVDYLPAMYPGRHYWPRAEVFGFVRAQLAPVAIACVLAYLGAWFRNRVNKRRERPGKQPLVSSVRTSSLEAKMYLKRVWLLITAEVVALATFFYCAEIAKDLYIEIAGVYELSTNEELELSFVTWHILARVAFWGVVALWLVAIVLAVTQHIKAGRSQYDFLTYRPPGLIAIALGLPVVGLSAGVVFSLFLPGL